MIAGFYELENEVPIYYKTFIFIKNKRILIGNEYRKKLFMPGVSEYMETLKPINQ